MEIKMGHLFFDNSWKYKICENCRKNSHEEVEMVREVIEENGKKEEMWVCPVCGATKKL
jgi:uncharacterized protein with PIN domain